MKLRLSWLIAAVICFTGLTLMTVFLTAEGALYLVVGWFFFLERTLPLIRIDWPSVFVGCLALGLFAGGLHAVGRSFLRSSDGMWKLRWSLACTALIVLLFAAGVASVGAIHQVGWLATAREPALVRSVNPSYGPLSRNNLRSVGMDFGTYASNRPPTYQLPKGGTFAENGTMLHSWEAQLLHENGYLFPRRPIDFTKPWNHPVNQDIFKDIHPYFLNPELRGAPVKDSEGYGLSHYAANSHVMAGNYAATYKEMEGNTATTILIGEVNANFKPWGHPINWRDPAKGVNRSPDGFGGAPGAGGANFLMVDGSVKFLSERTSPQVLRALSSPKAEDKSAAAQLSAALQSNHR